MTLGLLWFVRNLASMASLLFTLSIIHEYIHLATARLLHVKARILDIGPFIAVTVFEDSLIRRSPAKYIAITLAPLVLLVVPLVLPFWRLPVLAGLLAGSAIDILLAISTAAGIIAGDPEKFVSSIIGRVVAYGFSGKIILYIRTREGVLIASGVSKSRELCKIADYQFVC